MLEITIQENGDVHLSGWFDSTQVEKAKSVFQSVVHSITVDFSECDYISSAGIGILTVTQKRLLDKGASLRLINLNPHVSDVFHYAGLDKAFGLVES